MKTRLLITAVIACVSLPVFAHDEVSFKSDIRPLLNDYCLSCHVPGGKGFEKSGLDMRSYQSLMKGTQFGPVIKPKDSFGSTLIMLVEGRADPALSMPFGIKGGLSKDKIALLSKWIDQGAKDN
jgi:Planctomycete cytochrome C